MSGLKISRQEIERRIKCQLEEKSRREAERKARHMSADFGKECAVGEIRRLLYEFQDIQAEISDFEVDTRTGTALREEIAKEVEKLQEMIDYPLFSQTTEELVAYTKKCNKRAEQAKSELKKVCRRFAREESRQARLVRLDRIDEETAQEREKEAAGQEEVLETLYREELRQMEEEYLQEKITESMEEIGCHIIAEKCADDENRDQLFTYSDGCAVHVVENDGQITMEIVGVDYEDRKADADEEEYIQSQMESFENVYDEFSERLRRKGIYPKDGSELRIPVNRCHAKIVNLNDYAAAETQESERGVDLRKESQRDTGKRITDKKQKRAKTIAKEG